MPKSLKDFATFLIVGTTCFFLGVVFIFLPYDYHVLWSTPPDDAPAGQRVEDYLLIQEDNLRFLHSSPPLVSRILHIIIGVGLLGFFIKLYKPRESNMLFDGASLVLYVVGITVYITNIVKGLRMVTAGQYGSPAPEGEAAVNEIDGRLEGTGIGRDDSLRVLAASNTILALILMGVLALQAGQWYAESKEEAEIAEMDRKAAEKKRSGSGTGVGKKKQ